MQWNHAVMPSSFEPYTVVIILIATVTLFVWGRWRYDVVALIALMLAVILGAVPFDKVYSGLGNSAVITVACVMVISKVIHQSGVLDNLIRKIIPYTKNPFLHVAALGSITAILSAFMNNVGALALMMPIAIQTALVHKRSPSLILMPLALSSALGGLITVMGTPPNLLISAYRKEYVGQYFSMFDFAHVGLLTAIIGIIFITLIGWRLIPKQRKAESRAEDVFQIEDYITEIKVIKDSPVDGMTVRELENLIKGDFVLAGIIRKKRKRLALPPDFFLRLNDILIVETSAEDLKELLEVGKLELVHDKKFSSDILKSDEVGLVEAVVPQASRCEGRTSENLRMRSRYRINLLAIARQGKPFKQRLHKTTLRSGDVVLLQGPKETLYENTAGLGLFPLIERKIEVKKGSWPYLPVMIFGVAIVVAALQLVPIQIAFSGAVLFMLLFNVIPIRNLYDNIDWSIIVLLAAMIPVGNALQTTGGTALISHYFLALAPHLSAAFILLILLVATMTLSDFMNNAATTVVMAPLAVSIAQALHVNVDTFLMAVAIGASCSFLTPLGHQNNTLVMGPGGYKFFDYIRLGFPLEVLVVLTSFPLLLYFWPLTS